MKISTLLLASLIFSVAITASANSSLPEWTFMVYIDGDNNLEGNGIADINEMEKVGSNSHLKIVVIFDRTPGYDSSSGDWTDTRRGLITADSNTDVISSSLQSVGEKNMGDPTTLTDFVNWAITNYPASHYVLVLWNHGGGWRSNIDRINKEIAGLKSLSASASPEQKKSAQLRIAQLLEQKEKIEVLKEVCYDGTSGDYLYTSELRQALENVPTHIDIVSFDACLMQMVEVAYELKSEASIMVGSEETEPGDGWPYDAILSDLSANPSMTPAQLATVIVTRYGESYNGLETMSAIDLSEMSGLATALDTFADAVISSGTEWLNMFNARAVANYYDDAPNFRDLGGFLNAMSQMATNQSVIAAVNQSRNALQAAVIANHSYPSEGANGLSIYLTNLSSSPSPAYSAANILFAADTRWDEMLKAAGSQSIPDDSYEPNDTFSQAATISTGSYLGLCCKNDDWFKVYLPAGARVSIAMTHEYDEGDLDLQVYNSSGEEIASSETEENVEDVLYSITASGYYYIRIFGFLGAVNYYYSLFVYDATRDPGYTCSVVPYQFVDYTSAIRLVMGDDDFTAIPLGFQFNFYGQSNSTIVISANGYMTFGITGDMYNNLSIPIPSSGGSIPGGLIAPFWDDLFPPSSNGGVFYQVTGDEGDKKLIITWANCGHWQYLGPTEGVTFQAILQEKDDSILFNYNDVSFSNPEYDNGISATVGIQNQTGERGCVFSFNQPTLTDSMSLKFQLIPTPTPTPTPAFFFKYTFDNPGDEGWTPFSITGGTHVSDPLGDFYIANTTTSTPSTVGILDPGTPENVYDRWEMNADSPISPCEENYLYCARYWLRTTQSDKNKVPQVRMQWNNYPPEIFALFQVDKGLNAIGTNFAPYDSYFYKSPTDNAGGQNYLIYFDLVDFTSAQSGDIYCDKIEVTRQTPPVTSGTLVWDQDSDTDFGSFATFNSQGIFDNVTSGAGSGSIWLESPGPPGATSLYYGGWGSPFEEMSPSFEPGYLYKAIFTLHSESDDAQKHLPMIRLRLSNKTFDWIGMRCVRQDEGVYGQMPAPTGTDYYLYMPAPPNLTGIPGDQNDSMVINFDIVDGSAKEYGRVYLDRVQVWKYPLQ